ncbi:MAG: hypothetical protein U9N46_04135 [Euryarchaeota archaeon]|nr:MAG: hypothetical protein C5S47_01955 [ANME-2 cluster archaeon]MEA1864373.1 hypothetical protein [Euryarchaeota archaeon]
MDFEELRNILNREQKSKLTKLDSDFYESVRAYLDGLHEEQKTASGREVQFLADEIDAANDRLQRIFKFRVGKLVNLASLNLMEEIDGTRNYVDAMTPIERDIYQSVLDAMRRGWSAIDGMLARESRPPAPVSGVQPVEKAVLEEVTALAVENVRSASESDEVGVEPVKPIEPVHRELSGFTVVRVLKDLPTFVGADSNHYTLAKNDVLTLPDLNASVLCKRRAVLPIAIPAK